MIPLGLYNGNIDKYTNTQIHKLNYTMPCHSKMMMIDIKGQDFCKPVPNLLAKRIIDAHSLFKGKDTLFETSLKRLCLEFANTAERLRESGVDYMFVFRQLCFIAREFDTHCANQQKVIRHAMGAMDDVQPYLTDAFYLDESNLLKNHYDYAEQLNGNLFRCVDSFTTKLPDRVIADEAVLKTVVHDIRMAVERDSIYCSY